MAWRYDHKIYQNPTATQKKHLTKMRDFTLQYSQVLAGQKYNDFKEQVFSYLDNIVRGSSLVEAVNSLIRPYINTCKGQITQQMLIQHSQGAASGCKRGDDVAGFSLDVTFL